MKLMITLIKDKDNEETNPGESIVFNVTEKEAHDINNLMSTENFDKLKEFLQDMNDINGEKHNIGIDDIYGFEFRL